MRRAISLLALLLFAMNASLWANGEFSNDEFTGAYKGLPAGLQDLNDIDQNNLVMLDSDGNPITTPDVGFLATQFDFTNPVAVVADLFTLASFGFRSILNITFGITLLALKFQAPMAIVVFIGALNFFIVVFGAMELAAFINSVLRGGGAN